MLGHHHVPGGGPLELGGVDGGDGGAPPRLVADPVQGILGRVSTVASQTKIKTLQCVMIISVNSVITLH